MARFRTRRVGPRRKRQTKWCSAVINSDVPAASALAVADGFEMCQPTTAVIDQADPQIGWCKGQISISRVGSLDASPAVAWAIVMMRLVNESTLPTQVFNPFNGFDLEWQDILGMGHCEVPPTLLKADDTFIGGRGTTVTDINIRVSRKFARNTNNLFLWVVGDASGTETDNNYRVIASVRSLMKFG